MNKSICRNCGEEIYYLEPFETQEDIEKQCKTCVLCGTHFHCIHNMGSYDFNQFCPFCYNRIEKELQKEWIKNEMSSYLNDCKKYKNLPFMTYIWSVGRVQKRMEGKYTHFFNSYLRELEGFSQFKDQTGIRYKFKKGGRGNANELYGTKEQIGFMIRFGLISYDYECNVIDYSEEYLQTYLERLAPTRIKYSEILAKLENQRH